MFEKKSAMILYDVPQSQEGDYFGGKRKTWLTWGNFLFIFQITKKVQQIRFQLKMRQKRVIKSVEMGRPRWNRTNIQE